MKSVTIPNNLRFVLVSDLDHTLVNHSQDSHQDLLTLNHIWQTQFAHDSLLVYSTGRSPLKYDQLKSQTPMITPDVVVCSVGSEIYWRQQNGSFCADEAWERILDSNWDRYKLLSSVQLLDIKQLTLQEQSEQRPHKLSFDLDTTSADTDKESIIKKLQNVVEESGLDTKLIFSGNKYVDILPSSAGKGRALQYLLNKLREWVCTPQLGVQANGDSGNDIELFEVEGVRSCAVGNSMYELTQWIHSHPSPNAFIANEDCSAGIVQGMRHFGFLTEKLDPETKAWNDILTSLEFQLQNQPNKELKLSNSFAIYINESEITESEKTLNLPDLLKMKPSPLVFVDQFKVQTKDLSTEFDATFIIQDLANAEPLKSRLAGVLNVHLDSGMIIWDALHLKYEEKVSTLC